MDAVTLVAAAVAIAIDNSRQAALNDLLLDRERAAMRAADLECRAAQREYVGNQQLPRPVPQTIESESESEPEAPSDSDAPAAP